MVDWTVKDLRISSLRYQQLDDMIQAMGASEGTVVPVLLDRERSAEKSAVLPK